MDPMTFYVLADIHGQAAGLDHALDLIAADGGRDAPLYILGDLVDRGPDSRGVIDRLLAGLDRGRDWRVLRGNHDQMFLDMLQDQGADAAAVEQWVDANGGDTTLASYGIPVDAAKADPSLIGAGVPERHRAFLVGLPYYIEAGAFLFVHAGLVPGIPLGQQDPTDLLWIRAPFLDHLGSHPWLVLHGHTPLERPTHFGNRVDMDGGAGHGRPLIPAVFEGREGWLLTARGREPLRPTRR